MRRPRISGTSEILIPSALGSFAVHYTFAFACVCMCVALLGNLGAAQLRPLSSPSPPSLGLKLRFRPSVACDTEPVRILWGEPV